MERSEEIRIYEMAVRELEQVGLKVEVTGRIEKDEFIGQVAIVHGHSSVDFIYQNTMLRSATWSFKTKDLSKLDHVDAFFDMVTDAASNHYSGAIVKWHDKEGHSHIHGLNAYVRGGILDIAMVENFPA